MQFGGRETGREGGVIGTYSRASKKGVIAFAAPGLDKEEKKTTYLRLT